MVRRIRRSHVSECPLGCLAHAGAQGHCLPCPFLREGFSNTTRDSSKDNRTIGLWVELDAML